MLIKQGTIEVFLKAYRFSHFWLDFSVEYFPPLLEMFQGVCFEGSGLRLTLIVELDVPRLRDPDEVNNLHVVAESEIFQVIIGMLITDTMVLNAIKCLKLKLKKE